MIRHVLPRCFLIHKTKIYILVTRNYAKEVELPTRAYKLHKLDKPPPAKCKLSKEDGLDIYKHMATVRNFENEAVKMYRLKQIRGFCHLYIGQEAVAVGIFKAMRPQDTLISSYRIHAWAYLLGDFAIAPVLTELTGGAKGNARGYGGSMHMYGNRYFGGCGIVGSQVPQGAGVAFAHKYLGTGGANVTCYGDGAANQGQLFEAFNISKLWGLPALFVCENNHYGMGTSKKRSSANPDFYTRGDYVPGIWVDGMDVLSVREAARYALEYCSSGKGPLVMEASTYRYMGHSMSDPDTTYRTREEVKQEREKNDPIKNFREQMITAGLAAIEDFKKIDDQIKKNVAEAAKFAISDKPLPKEQLAYDIYIKNETKSIRGPTPWTSFPTGNYNWPAKERPSPIKKK